MSKGKTFINIGFVSTCMLEFDEVLDVMDVRNAELPDISDPEHTKAMREFLSKFGLVVSPGVVGDVESARCARRMFSEKEIDVLVVYEFGFTLSATIHALMKELHVPVIFWNTQARRNMDDKTNFSVAMANNSISSVPHSSNILFQAGKRDFWVVTGSESDDCVQLRFTWIFNGVAAKKRLSMSKIAAIGYVYPGMHTLSVNEEKFCSVFGVTVNHVNPLEIKKYFIQADNVKVEIALGEMRQSYLIQDLSDYELTIAARYEVALKDFVTKHDINAITLLCGLLILDKEMGTTPCYALSRLSQAGVHSSCECDIPTAAALVIAQEIAGNAHFTEFYMMDMDKKIIQMCHCGYGNISLANEKYPPKIVPQPCYPGPCGKGAGFEFVLRPGIATIFSITDSPDGYKLVAALVECLDMEAYPTACPQAIIRFKEHSMADGIERFCKAGGSHHMALCLGDITCELDILSHLLKIEYEKI